MRPVIDTDGFDRQIETTYQKLEALLERMSTSGEEASIANEALEELSTTLEELHVASEELSRQNTELAAAHLAAQAERQRYQDLFDFAPDGYLVTDTNGVIREANRAAADLLHVTQERLVGKPLAVYVAEAERKAFRDILSTLLKRAITGANEWEIGLKPRTSKELRASITVTPVVPISAVPLPPGKELTDGVGLRWSLRDITESKRAEERERLLEETQHAMQEAVRAKESLQVSEERYRVLVESSPDLIIRYDREMRLVFANPAMQLRTGKPADRLMGRTAQEYGAAQASASIWEQNFRRVLESGETQRFDNSSIYQGQVRIYDILAVPEFAADGTVAMVMVIARDITEKRQAEEALRKSEADLRGILDATRESIWMFDPDGSILMANETALRRLKRPAEGVIGQQFGKFVPAELAETRQACIRKVIETGNPVELEDERAGISFHHIFYPIKDERGNVVRITAFSQDITESKRADEALQTNSERFYNVLSSMYTGLLLVTDESRVEFANQAFCDYFELKDNPEDLKGAAGGEILTKIKPAYVHPDEAIERIQEIVKLGDPIKGEEVAMRSGRLLIRDFIPIHVNGKSYGRLWYHTDISERKQAEQALQESEERFKAIASSTPDHIFVQDRSLRYAFVVNPQLGLTEKDMLGKTDRELVTGEQAEQLTTIKRQVMVSGKAIHVEMPIVAAQGDVQFFDGSYVPKYDAEGQVDGLIGYFKNVTELKRIEAKMRASEERYRNLFNRMDEGFCIIEMIFDEQERPADYRFLEANPAFEKQTGLHEAQGKLMRSLAPEPEAYWFETYGKIALSGEPAHFIHEARQLKRWFEVYAYRIGNPEERHVAIIFNDISERKQAEEKLRASNDELKRFNKAMVGRELRMVELKNEVNELCKRAGLPERYSKDNGPQTSDGGGMK